MENPISLNAVTPAPTPLQPHDLAPQFTCLSCLIGFPTGEAQREHYRSDHHRYNMKVCIHHLYVRPVLTCASVSAVLLDYLPSAPPLLTKRFWISVLKLR